MTDSGTVGTDSGTIGADSGTIGTPGTSDNTETVDNVDDVPIGWVRVANTDRYTRACDNVTMSFADAITLTSSQPVKAEEYLTLPAIVKFYQEHVAFCSSSQADKIIGDWHALMTNFSNTNGLQPHTFRFTVPIEFWTCNTNAVCVELDFRVRYEQVQVVVSTASVRRNCVVDTYTFDENVDQFPTMTQIVQHVPVLYDEMRLVLEIIKKKQNGNMIAAYQSFYHGYGLPDTDAVKDNMLHNDDIPSSRFYNQKNRIYLSLQIKPSILSIDTRKVIIELDDEEADLTARLEVLRKRKRDLEEAGRNVRVRSVLCPM